MPYKRRARVLFVADGSEAALAHACAQRIGADWLEPCADKSPPSAAALAWADLVVSLDESAQATMPALPPNARHVHWRIAGHDDIERRMLGMIGGMRLLSRNLEDPT